MGRKAQPIEIPKPDAVAAAPSCPDWLPEAAKVVWDSIVPFLEAKRILTKTDVLALSVLSSTYAEWQQLAREIAEEGRCYECKTEAGAIMMRANPKVAMLSDASRRVIAVLSEFGLSPAARARDRRGQKAPEATWSFPHRT